MLTRLASRRALCSWVTASRTEPSSSAEQSVELDRLFFDERLQALLRRLTRVEPRRVLADGVTRKGERTHFQLMSEKEIQRVHDRLTDKASKLLQFPPLVNARKGAGDTLSMDEQIQGYDSSNLVFTDITFGLTPQERCVVVREPSGRLRTATVEENDRMERTYFPQPERPIIEPLIFEHGHLLDALSRQQHKHILDHACYQFEPDDPDYIRIVKKVYDHVNAGDHFELLSGTRHNGSFLLYLVANKKLDNLIYHQLQQYRNPLHRVSEIIDLYHLVFPESKSALSTSKSVRDKIETFLKSELPDSVKLSDAMKKTLDRFASETDMTPD